MLRDLLEKEKKSLTCFFEKIDLEKFEELIQVILSSSGKIVITGVGKSGLIAKKIAVTMTSIGSRSFYLSPTDALHGDIGLVSEGDIFILLSKSGETEELLNLIPYVRNKKAVTVAIVCSSVSRLSKACDFFLNLPLDQELCPMNLVPTTSAVVQAIFGDLLSVELMLRKNFTIDDYAMNHPAGRIGKRMILKVEDIMLRGSSVPFCYPEDLLVDTLPELSNKQCGCVLIVDEKKCLIGIFTDGDLRRVLQRMGPKVMDYSMEKLMIKSARWIGCHKLAWEAIQLMEIDQKHPITALPVLQEDRVVIGLIRMHDLVQAGV